MTIIHIVQSIPKNERTAGLGAGAGGGSGAVRGGTPTSLLMSYQFCTRGTIGCVIGAVIIPDGEDE